MVQVVVDVDSHASSGCDQRMLYSIELCIFSE